jgi:beta-lactamase class A
MKKLLAVASIVAIFGSCGPENNGKEEVPTEKAKPDHTTLLKQLDSLAYVLKGKFALGYIHMERGDTFSYNGNEHKPMQSTAKFPLALMVMQQLDAGKLSLDQKVGITEADMASIQRSPLWESVGKKSAYVTVHDMLDQMVAVSDNLSCNKFTELMGGVGALVGNTHTLGMTGFQLVAKEGNAGAIDFGRPYDNWCTPSDMAALLAKFYSGKILSKVSTDSLRSIMERAARERISRQLPEGTVVAHKTGTSGMEDGVTTAVNDIGIVTLPNGEHLVLAIFVTEVEGDMEAGEAIIATVAKAAYDHAVK